MFYIYSKEKKSKLAFTVNLTADEVMQFMDGNLFQNLSHQITL